MDPELRQNQLTYIINQIQTDANLVALLRIAVTNNIGNVSDTQLQALYTALGGT